MPSPFTPSTDDVRKLAISGQVAADPDYHGWDHGFRFEDIVLLLRYCFRVEPDYRPENPTGFVATCWTWERRRVRVDFNLGESAEGKPVILVVTAMEVT